MLPLRSPICDKHFFHLLVVMRTFYFSIIKPSHYIFCMKGKARVMNDSDFCHYFLGSCGVSSLGNSRVIGGDDAIPGAWPWQVCELIFSNSFKNSHH